MWPFLYPGKLGEVSHLRDSGTKSLGQVFPRPPPPCDKDEEVEMGGGKTWITQVGSVGSPLGMNERAAHPLTRQLSGLVLFSSSLSLFTKKGVDGVCPPPLRRRRLLLRLIFSPIL